MSKNPSLEFRGNKLHKTLQNYVNLNLNETKIKNMQCQLVLFISTQVSNIRQFADLNDKVLEWFMKLVKK